MKKDKRPDCCGEQRGAQDHIGCVTIQSHPIEFHLAWQDQAHAFDPRSLGGGGQL